MTTEVIEPIECIVCKKKAGVRFTPNRCADDTDARVAESAPPGWVCIGPGKWVCEACRTREPKQ